ncbi:MAG TPA: hypothetical protein VF765_27130 [Polyangiaceae bacterium]
MGRRAPPARWEAYLLIGIFPEGARLRWCKVHVFVGRARPGRHCLSALEALDGAGEIAVMVADERRVERRFVPTEDASCTRAADAWKIDAPGVAWSGFPETRLSLGEPRAEVTASADAVAWWARIPRVLSYFTGFGPLTWSDARGAVSGVGLVEHAWGADAPVDVARFAPARWQWDVMTAETGEIAALLTISGRALRTMNRPSPAGALATGWRGRIRVREWSTDEGRRVPARWTGAVATSDGPFHYEARASSSVAPVVPDGGFLSSTWEGTWAGRGVRGTGFTEYRAV